MRSALIGTLIVVLAGAPGCLTIATVERLADSLEPLDYRGLTRSHLEGDVRVVTVRYQDWRNGTTRLVAWRLEPTAPGQPLSTEAALDEVPRKIPPDHHVARMLAGGAVLPLTALADLASLPLFPFNVWVAVELDVIELFPSVW